MILGPSKDIAMSILRGTTRKYLGFGGESYVHDIMDGEELAWKMTGEGIVPDSTKDLAWINELGEAPWPFETEEVHYFEVNAGGSRHERHNLLLR